MNAQQQIHQYPAEANVVGQVNQMPFLDEEQLDHAFWDMLEVF
jgi:hypothetical protein